MRFASLSLALSLFSLLASAASLDCPKGTTESSIRQANTMTLSCLDSVSRPHGPFEVWAYPDTLLKGHGVLIVEGGFEHGKKQHTWTTYSKDGAVIDRAEFNMGKKQEATNGTP